MHGHGGFGRGFGGGGWGGGGWGRGWGGGGFGLGWLIPSLLFGSVISNTLNRPQPYPVPYPVQQPPTPGPQPAQNGAPAVTAPAQATVTCQNCSQVVNAGFAFCPHCGSRLAPNACRYCGQVMSAGQAYCPKCGAPRK